jgi:superfamily I DNA and RNA helicase
LDHLKYLIFPVVRIELPERQSDNSYETRAKRLNVLDQNQEAIARKFDGGHRIIMGPPGSGKTLILAHKAAVLKQYNPNIKNILFVCYNITLVNYIRRLLSDKKVPMGKDGVDVFHFFELCSKIIGEEVAHENEDSEYYEMVVQEALSKVKDFDNKYDAILVDEGQDFSDDMYRVVTGLLNKDTNNLTIALDEKQNLYRRKYSWKDVGVQAQGRIHKISYVYRNTKEIAEFANNFMSEKSPGHKDKESNQSELFPDFFDFHGPKPELKQFSDYDSIAEYISDKISEIIEKEACPQSEIAILYTMKSSNNGAAENIPHLIQQSLESKGVLCSWASEDYRSKKNYDITTNSVTISTIHSVKGLDYSCVFLIGLDCLDAERWSNEQVKNLTYVAMTRARYQLFIPFIKESSLIRKMT